MNRFKSEYVILANYVNSPGACGGYLFYSGQSEPEVCMKALNSLQYLIAGINEDIYPSQEEVVFVQIYSELLAKGNKVKISDLLKLELIATSTIFYKIVASGKGKKGILSVLDCLYRDIQDDKSDWLWGDKDDKDCVFEELLDLKSRLRNDVYDGFMKELSQFIPYMA